MSLTQVTEAGNSNNMEKLEFIKALNNLRDRNFQIKQITTDWHRHIHKYSRKEQKGIMQQFDV